jgi:UDP-N-acetylglucosamine 2-epimerase (non-hydrolysing)
MNVLVPLGTRPEIVKGAPVVRALRSAGFATHMIATGQHEDALLSEAFFHDLDVEPDVRWVLPHDEGERVGKMATLAYHELAENPPDIVLVVGDTYTVPVFALAARRFRVPLVHVEAGLRSFNETSLEELNRKVVMSSASLHFAPTELAATFLAREGVPADRIHVVGNPVIDTLREWDLAPRALASREGVTVTAHRATNVDDPRRLSALVRIVMRLADEVGPVTFPLQPRTRARLEADGLFAALDRHERVQLLDPLPHRAMLELIAGSLVVVTDSGGLQEEAAWCGGPIVVLRRSTPRWEGVIAGSSVLAGLDVERSLQAAAELACPEAQARVSAMECPYGDGQTATRIVDVLSDPAVVARLTLDERDFVGAKPPS